MYQLDVCFSPALFEYYAKDNIAIVMVDAIRASASICTALHNGAQHIIPLADVEETLTYKSKGYKIAGERNSQKVEGFDFGNSPFNFSEENIKNHKLAFTTTNGTQVISLVKNCTLNNIALLIGSFINISALSEYLAKEERDLLIICSGWKNTVNIEDSLFAGRLIHLLLKHKQFKASESANLALKLYEKSDNSYFDFVMQNSPRLKQKATYLENDFRYCLSEDLVKNIPFLKEDKLVNLI